MLSLRIYLCSVDVPEVQGNNLFGATQTPSLFILFILDLLSSELLSLTVLSARPLQTAIARLSCSVQFGIIEESATAAVKFVFVRHKPCRTRVEVSDS